MATAYTPILKLALPVTGELNGTWGNTVNDNITSMVEQAIAGLATINTWTANSHTLTTADGTTSESRCAMLVIDDDGAGNPSAAATVVCPTATKSYIVQNLCGQTVTVKTAAGTGVAVPNNQSALVFCNGTNVVTGAFNGDVVGPASATDNAIARYDGTTGKLVQNSAVTIADDGATVITANSSSSGLRITQTGAGNALLVEDSASTDSTPFVVSADGRVGIGTQSPQDILDVSGDGYITPSFRAYGASSGNYPAIVKGRGTQASPAAVQSGDELGGLVFKGYDGTSNITAALIRSDVGGTPGTNDMPGRLVFSTTADGASSVTERMYIDSAGTVSTPDSGRVQIGSGIELSSALVISRPLTGKTVVWNTYTSGYVQSDVTSQAKMYVSYPSTAAASFTLPSLVGFSAQQNSIGAGSTVTNQIGFEAAPNLTGATNNYGFYSNIASGTGRWNFYANGTASNYFGGATTISVNSSSDALRITQVGAGNALLVEDSANPDATPTVIDANGKVIIGNTSAITTANFNSPLQIMEVGNGVSQGGATLSRWATTVNSPKLSIAHSGGTSIGDYTIVRNNDGVGKVDFLGSDGTAFIAAAQIESFVDGTPGANDMPGRLVFSTTADGASSPTERMRITSSGNVGIGASSLPTQTFRLGTPITGGTTAWGAYWGGTVQPTVTSSANYNQTIATTAENGAVPYTITGLKHYSATQDPFNADSTVTNQYGFTAESALTGATNNYGFYGNIASGTGRYNFYANGTADNFFGGATTISVNSSSDALRITQVGAGNALLIEDSANPDASPVVVDSGGNLITGLTSLASTPSTFYSTIQSHSTANQSLGIGLFNYSTGTAARGDLAFYKSLSGTAGTLSAVSANVDLGSLNFFGAGDASTWLRAAVMLAEVDTGTVSATSMPGRLVFATTPDGSATSVERMRIDSAGRVGIGASTVASIFVNIGHTLTGATSVVSVRAINTIASDVTTAATLFRTQPFTQAAAFTLSSLSHYQATQGTIGATSAVTNQYGFFVDTTLVGATNNYGFYGNIASGTGRFNFYAAGTAANVFAGQTSIGGLVGAESLRVTPVASAVNYIEAQGQITAGAPSLSAAGSDTNIDLLMQSKGTGLLNFATGTGGTQFLIAHTASSVNFIQASGGVAGSGPTFTTQGSDTNVPLFLSTKGTGQYFFASNSATQFNIGNTASAVNYLRVNGGATGNAATLSAQGTDTNIDITLTPKGTGRVRFGTLTGTSDVAITGYIEVKDSAGTVRKLAVIT